MNAITPGMPISSGACLDNLEQMDDFAHTSGRYRQAERMLSNDTNLEIRASVLRVDIQHHRALASYYGATWRWFRAHPAVASIPDKDLGHLKRYEAQQNFTIHRIRHGRLCKELGALLRHLRDQRAISFQLAAE